MTTNFDNILRFQNSNFCFVFLNNFHSEDVNVTIICHNDELSWLFTNNLSGPPRVSQSGVELEKNFECGFMASDDAYG